MNLSVVLKCPWSPPKPPWVALKYSWNHLKLYKNSLNYLKHHNMPSEPPKLHRKLPEISQNVSGKKTKNHSVAPRNYLKYTWDSLNSRRPPGIPLELPETSLKPFKALWNFLKRPETPLKSFETLSKKLLKQRLQRSYRFRSFQKVLETL